MKEEFLHHLWLHKKINVTNLQTCSGEKLEILNFGNYLQAEGPDFFNAQLLINGQHWAGNVEMHLKSSDWYVHNHQNDKNYDNVILHVVWENDVAIFRSNNTEIPVLELKNFVSNDFVIRYKDLVQSKKWINCENSLDDVDSFLLENWKERLYIEKLESKLVLIQELLEHSNNDWEYVFFVMLAKNFGLNTNGFAFLEMAKRIPFSIIRKEKENLEPLFFGVLNLLHDNFEDNYCKQLHKDWQFLKAKFNLQEIESPQVQFFKLRPDNFPTIRIAQLAQLYQNSEALFLKTNSFTTTNEIYNVFSVATNAYWDDHYNFEKPSKKQVKKISKSFVDLLILNTIIPLKYKFNSLYANQNIEDIIALAQNIAPEKNTVIEKFKQINVESKNAFDTQSLLFLKQNYCDKQKCLNCQIGVSLLKQKL